MSHRKPAPDLIEGEYRFSEDELRGPAALSLNPGIDVIANS
jgi:hypothetical protein